MAEEKGSGNKQKPLIFDKESKTDSIKQPTDESSKTKGSKQVEKCRYEFKKRLWNMQ